MSTNLYDGIDLYEISEDSIRLKTTVIHNINVNVIRKIVLIHDDKEVLVGGDDGYAYIMNTKSQALVQKLKHGASK